MYKEELEHRWPGPEKVRQKSIASFLFTLILFIGKMLEMAISLRRQMQSFILAANTLPAAKPPDCDYSRLCQRPWDFFPEREPPTLPSLASGLSLALSFLPSQCQNSCPLPPRRPQ